MSGGTLDDHLCQGNDGRKEGWKDGRIEENEHQGLRSLTIPYSESQFYQGNIQQQ
jgi:hypothetical protein